MAANVLKKLAVSLNSDQLGTADDFPVASLAKRGGATSMSEVGGGLH
jgi:hypothetical protein